MSYFNFNLILQLQRALHALTSNVTAEKHSFPRPVIYINGDSMAADLIDKTGDKSSTILADELGIEVYENAYGGSSPAAISTRQGGRKFYVKLSENLPADTSSIDIASFKDYDPWTPRGSSDTFTGTLAGIPVKLRRIGLSGDADTLLKFTVSRITEASAETEIPSDTQFVFDEAENYKDAIQILHASYNWIRTTSDRRQFVVDEMIKCIEHLSVSDKRFLIVPLVNGGGKNNDYNDYESDGTIQGRWRGTDDYNDIIDLNKRLKNAFGPYYLNGFREYFTQGQALEDALNQGLISEITDKDRLDIEFDSVPQSLRNPDDFHWNAVAYRLKAQFFARAIKARGLLINTLKTGDE